MDLITAGLNAMLPDYYVTTEQEMDGKLHETCRIVTINELLDTINSGGDVSTLFHSKPCPPLPPEPKSKPIVIPSCPSSIEVYVSGLEGGNISIHVPVYPHTPRGVLIMKQVIANKTGIDREEMRLIFAGRQLEGDKSLAHYCISNGSIVFITIRLTGGGGYMYVLVINDNDLDPPYHYDFTQLKDDGTKYVRGGYPYYRPYGWNRYALKVKGKYENDVWLGSAGIRTESSPGEWPVSYHGTKEEAAKSIASVGYQDKYLKRQAFGPGHYSSPNISVAEGYATQFTKEGKTYKIVIQNRVNMSATKIVPMTGGDYWVTTDPSCLRPYGICIKEVK